MQNTLFLLRIRYILRQFTRELMNHSQRFISSLAVTRGPHVGSSSLSFRPESQSSFPGRDSGLSCASVTQAGRGRRDQTPG